VGIEQQKGNVFLRRMTERVEAAWRGVVPESLVILVEA